MEIHLRIPELRCADSRLTEAFRIAVGDIAGNVHEYTKGLLEPSSPCLMAGFDYPDTWVRDASINISNAGFMLSDEICRNTLLSCVQQIDGKYRIVHKQPWDCVIWSMGAWSFFCESGEVEFGRQAYEILRDTLDYYEDTEWDADSGLFCGPGVYADGVSGYPDRYGVLPDTGSGIAFWGKQHPKSAREKGLGIPMKTLSTNCAYVYAYETAAKLAEEFEKDGQAELMGVPERTGALGGCDRAKMFRDRANRLRERINSCFWNSETGRYDYMLGECDSAEGIGLAFSILWDIADDTKAQSIADHTPMTGHGVACLYPTFERYSKMGGYGRHSGTVWPFINAYWALAMKKIERTKDFDRELFGLAQKAVRDLQFTEIYHPDTGEPYGGLQEVSGSHEIRSWGSCRKQTWSATGFVSMIVDGILGRRLERDTITFRPYLPEGIDSLTLSGYRYGEATLNITVKRSSDSEESLPGEITLHRGCLSQELILVVRD